jgi:FHA domain/FhaA, N-terminal domain
MRFMRKAGAPANKSAKRLHVEPAELARKLIKEMDDHTVARGDHVWVRNRYTVYLCPEDYEKLAPRAPQVTADLTGKLAKHVRDMGYLLQGDLVVEVVLDNDLELGYFGILAQRVYPEQAATGKAAQPAPAATAPVAGVAAGAAAAASRQPDPAELKIPASTEVLAAKQAEELGLARRVIVISSGDRVREFTQSRVVLGRSKEADLRIDDPNVSRKHAAIYWNDDRLMIEDLGSTNGTMVNGYPVTTTILRPQDVVAIGDSRLTVESK